MKPNPRDLGANLVALGAVALAGVAARNAVHKGWKLGTRREPPLNPANRDTPWQEAVAWAVCSGVIVGLARLFARRGTDALLSRRLPRPAGWQGKGTKQPARERMRLPRR